MPAYIQSTSMISPQDTCGEDSLEQPRHEVCQHLLCVDPDYKALIPPARLRRMSRILKMGLAGSSLCIQRSPVKPDAVIVGTGLSCVTDLERFMRSCDDEHEQMLSPTPFINSSHNSVAGQIAMANQITGYNNTHFHGVSSLESALVDALMLLDEGDSRCVLVGGVDEYSQMKFDVFSRVGWWRQQPVDNLELLHTRGEGSIMGEGAAFFALSGQPSGTDLAQLVDVTSSLCTDDADEALQRICAFLERQGIALEDVDVIVDGRNGDGPSDAVYEAVEALWGARTGERRPDVVAYKHLCGEYLTASGFGLWLSVRLLHGQHLPACAVVRRSGRSQWRNVLFYNCFRSSVDKCCVCNYTESMALLRAV